MRHFISVWNRTSLIKRIIIGVILGLILGVAFPKLSGIGILGDLFVGGLKAVAPLLVFVLVANALSQHEKGQKTNMSTVVGLYLVGTLAAALVAVLVNYIFPLKLTLDNVAESDLSAPEGVAGSAAANTGRTASSGALRQKRARWRIFMRFSVVYL